MREQLWWNSDVLQGKTTTFLPAKEGQLQLCALSGGGLRAEKVLCADQASSAGYSQADGKGERDVMG